MGAYPFRSPTPAPRHGEHPWSSGSPKRTSTPRGPGWRRATRAGERPAAFGAGRERDAGMWSPVVNVPGATHGPPAVVLGRALGHSRGAAVYDLVPGVPRAAGRALAPARACTVFDHPDLCDHPGLCDHPALFARRDLLDGPRDADRLVAVFVRDQAAGGRPRPAAGRRGRGAGAGELCHHGGMSFVLVFVDVQENFLDGSGAVPDAAPLRGELAALLDRARATGTPVVHVLNDGAAGEPDEPFTPGWQPVFPAREEEPVFRKTEPDSFTSPGLAGALALTGARGLVLAGFQSEFCISATARRALGEGYDVVLARGAHGTYPEGGATAAERAADVERGLEAAGIGISPARDIEFR